MLRTFAEVLAQARQKGPLTIVVAAAQDDEALRAVKAAHDEGLAEAVLVGDAAQIRRLLPEVGLPENTPLVDEPDPALAALKAVAIVRRSPAAILVKGLVNSSDFLRAVLDPEQGLRTDRLLSHFAAFEEPGGEKLTYHTDGGMNITPGLAEKKQILENALLALQALGIEEPRVAVLAANEIVNPKMPETVDAQALMEMSRQGELPKAVVEGPVSMDVALSPQAAAHKKIQSAVSGQVDLFLVPDISAGNILGKALIYYGKFKSAGVILGATHPVVMVSRADTAQAKLNSIALACCISFGQRQRQSES